MEEIKEIAGMLHIHANWIYLVVPVVIMGFDILTGFLNAWRTDTIQSSKMRSGLSKKFGEMIIIIISLFLHYTIGLPIELTTFLTIYITVTELISIIENLSKLGVNMPAWLTQRLKSIVDEGLNNEHQNR